MRTNSMFHRPMKLLAVGSLLFAALLAGQSALAATIIGSKHDLTSAAGGGAYTANALAEPCAFCHTPHGASTAAQLWNRGAPATLSFGLYTSTTMGTAAVQPGANSLLCLSCHDGATALDLIINRPGSGGLNPLGLSAGYTFVGGTGNLMLAASAANLGTSLANDHPIGIPYCGGATLGVCTDPDFFINKLYLDTTVVAPSTTAGLTTGWWIDTGVTANGGTAAINREKQDLPLYQVGAVIPRVECATCHEPHNATAVVGATSFLRIANTSSAMCVACHNK